MTWTVLSSPHSEINLHFSRETIYPVRKSELEILLDQFFMNEQLIRGTRDSEAILSKMRLLQVESPSIRAGTHPV